MSENDRFSQDDAQAMPSVTLLLDRRKLGLELAPSGPTIKPTKRQGERKSAPPLELWSAGLLKLAPAPEVIAVNELFSQGFSWAVVFLKTDQPDTFEAKAVAGGSRERWGFWAGMKLNPQSAPALWARLTKESFTWLEAQDPGAQTLISTLGGEKGETVVAFQARPVPTPVAILLAGGLSVACSPSLLEKVRSILK
ncbi:MAG: hypothetical protein RJB38_1606 [Pseudomonadota bacterium]|jgi:hypothetical protein